MAKNQNGGTGSCKELPRPPLPETIVCWQCEQEIPLSTAKETCPLCGAILTEASFDEAAGVHLRKMAEIGTEVGLAKQQLEKAEARNVKLGFLRKLSLFPSRREITRLTAEISAMHESINALSNTLKRLAQARYYISRWFHMTGTPLCNLGQPGATAFGTPRYALGSKGAVRFTCKATKYPRSRKGFVAAQYAEYETFCAIQRIVDSGALGHARPLANLVVPYDEDGRQRYNKHVRAHEIDALLVTERSIVVVEVKSTWMAVTIDYRRQSRKHHIVRVGMTKRGDQFGSEQVDGAVQQAVAHCWTLVDTGTYSIQPGSLAGLVVYSGAPEVRLYCEQGEGRPPIYFASLNHDELSLEKALHDAVFASAPARSPAEVDAVADELFARYADLDGSKREEHRERIKRDARVNTAPTPSRKRVRDGRASQDAELERMLLTIRSPA